MASLEILEEEDTENDGLPTLEVVSEEPATISMPPAPDWFHRNAPTPLAKAFDWLLPWATATKGNAIEADDIGGFEQEPSIKKFGADANELIGTVGGGIIGTVGGTRIAGPTGGYVGSGLGAEGGSAFAKKINKETGLRSPLAIEADPKRYDVPSLAQFGENSLRDILTGPAITAAARIGRGVTKIITPDRAYRDLAGFTNKRNQLRAGMSDTLTDYRTDFPEDITGVPEIFSRKAALKEVGDDPAGQVAMRGIKDAPADIPANLGAQELSGTPHVWGDIAANIKTAKEYWGGKIDDILSRTKTKLTVKDVGLSDLRDSLTKEGTEITTRAADDVFSLEMDNLAKRALSEDDFVSYQTARKALTDGHNKIIELKRYGKKPPADLLERMRIDGQAVNNFEGAIDNLPLTAEEVRRMKSEWASNARFDKRTTPDAFESSRAAVYEKLSGQLRDKLNAVVDSDASLSAAERTLFKKSLAKYGALSGVEKQTTNRAAQATQRGTDTFTGQTFETEKKLPGEWLPLIGEGVGAGLKRMYPEIDVPLARVQRGLGQSPHPALMTLQGIIGTLRGLGIGAQDVFHSVEKAGLHPATPTALAAIGPTGGGPAPEVAGAALDFLEKNSAQYRPPGGPVDLQPAIQPPFAPQPFANGLPRATDAWSGDALKMFLQMTAKGPTAPVAQGLAAKLLEAQHLQDKPKAERILADMARLFPHTFEPGAGINNKLFHPDEQAEYMNQLRGAQKKGVVDSIFLAKQRDAFLDKTDARILPVEQGVMQGAVRNRLNAPPSGGEGRKYPY